MTISIWWFLLAVLYAILATVQAHVAIKEREEWKRMANKQALAPLTAKELAAQKRISVSTVARLAREGKIKAEKVGRQWRISQEGE